MSSMTEDIDLGEALSGSGSSTQTSSSGGGGGRRSTIIIDSLYGSEQFPPDTKCQKCGERAVGVLEKKEILQDEKVIEYGQPLCGNHRDAIKRGNPETFEVCEFTRFVDA